MSETLLKVVFVGGLTNGKIVHDYLQTNKYVDLLMSFTYRPECSAARFVPLKGEEPIMDTGTLVGNEQLIRQLCPDIIIVAGWSEIVPAEILDIPTMGVIGFHPAKLPMDRGRSVLAWQIEDGYRETALTMFRYSKYPDGGDIIAQDSIKIEANDYINDVLDKVDKATENLMRAYFPLIRQGLAQYRIQNLSEGSFRRLRGPRDSQIDWNQNTEIIYNKIRAISHPYPGAMSIIDGEEYVIWRAEPVVDFPYGAALKAGTIVARLFDGSFVVKTRNSYLRITEYDTK